MTITHILCMSESRILVSTDGIKTCIYEHLPPMKQPFKKDNWRMIHQMKEIENQRIKTSMLAEDYFILGNDDCHFFMFDVIGYSMIEKGYIRNYTINCMLLVEDNMVVFGHQGGILSLWDTSKRVLDPEELDKLHKSIIDT